MVYLPMLAVAQSIYIALNHATSKQYTARNVEESHNLIAGTILASGWRGCGIPHKNLKSGQSVSKPRIELGPFENKCHTRYL
jgi:hypothetical protein